MYFAKFLVTRLVKSLIHNKSGAINVPIESERGSIGEEKNVWERVRESAQKEREFEERVRERERECARGGRECGGEAAITVKVRERSLRSQLRWSQFPHRLSLHS